MERPAALLNIRTGREYVLGKVTTIGRLRRCEITVTDDSVSRYHARITYKDGHYILQDLESRNGTYVDGKRITDAVILTEGNHIAVGGEIFQFERYATGGKEALTPGAVSIVDDSGQPAPEYSSKLAVRGYQVIGEAVKAEETEAKKVALETAARCWEIMTRLRKQHVASSFLEEMASAVMSSFDQAAGCVIVTREGVDGALTVRTDRRRKEGDTSPVRIRRSVVDHVVNDAEAVVMAEKAGEGESSAEHGVMCVPLALEDRVIGVIYVLSEAGGKFGEDELRLVSAVANEAAPVLDNLIAYEEVCKERDRLRRETAILHQLPQKYSFSNIIGRTPAIKQAIAEAEAATENDNSVLIIGEPGTGREMLAEAIHYNSKRRMGPFVVANCYADNPRLQKVELFGGEVRSASGKVVIKRGAIEQADGGTLYISDIDQLAPPLQADFLGVMERGELQYASGARKVKVDVRVIASASRPLKELVADGRFSESLFYRMNAVSISLPALIDRKADIPILLQHFVRRFSFEMNKPIKGFAEPAMAFLQLYSWPRNVRELKNLVEKAVMHGKAGTEIQPAELPSEMKDLGMPSMPSREPRELTDTAARLEKQIIEETLRQCDGNKEEAARALGLTVGTLEEKLRKLGLG